MHISPNGVGFVKAEVKRGVLPRMLEEILDTRIMVKGAMKKAKQDKVGGGWLMGGTLSHQISMTFHPLHNFNKATSSEPKLLIFQPIIKF